MLKLFQILAEDKIVNKEQCFQYTNREVTPTNLTQICNIFIGIETYICVYCGEFQVIFHCRNRACQRLSNLYVHFNND